MPEQKAYLPNIFSPFTLANSIIAFEGLASLGKAELLKPPFTNKMVSSSLKHFVRDFTDSGDFEALIKGYLKEDSTLDPKQFTLLTHEGYSYAKKPPYNIFYYDGFTSLLLFYGDLRNKIGVTASLELKGNKNSFQGMNDSQMTDDDIIINQIQGPLYNKAIAEVKETFSEFRWEKLFVEIFINWARQSGLQRIFLLPSAYNEWNTVQANTNGTALLRYDVTAKRLGFKQKNKHEPYILTSDEKTKELFDIFLKDFRRA